MMRMKNRVREEMKRHSLITSSTRVNGKISIDQLIKLLEFRPLDLSVNI
jgi:hypothetical protein